MEEKERYVVKKISKDCLFPETLCELKDTKSKFFVVLESKEDAVKIADLLNQQDKRIKDVETQLEIHNEYYNSFNCDSFDEFTDFISTFMLTPHEEQTLIKDLKKQLKQSQKQLAIDVLERLHNDFASSIGNGMLRTYVCGLIKDKISELKGELK